MWCTWATLLLVSSALVTAEAAAVLGEAESTEAPALITTTAPSILEENLNNNPATTLAPEDATVEERRQAVATTRSPPRTLDRKAAELAWRSWLQSAESGNQNAPPRRITTKSLFITPLVCPKGQRLDRNGCVQVVTVNNEEHERILLEQLNALFSSPATGDVLYDYGDDEPGPLQLSIPIGLDPQAAALQNQEPSAQAQEFKPNYVKKDEQFSNNDASIEAELELMKLQHNNNNYSDQSGILNHNVMNSLLPYGDKPKRDSPLDNSTEVTPLSNTTDAGQKEMVYGHVNIDPILYNMDNKNQKETNPDIDMTAFNDTSLVSLQNKSDTDTLNGSGYVVANTKTDMTQNITTDSLSKTKDQSKLNPENDYSDIGEAIKLISRYAEVSTDDNFNKDQKKNVDKEDSILGTRTKLQYRRNKPKSENPVPPSTGLESDRYDMKKMVSHSFYPNNEPVYRYPWPSQHSATPPPNYPFRHIQDYWPGKNYAGGVYNTHGNPRRHHHSYPHYFRPRGYYPESYTGPQAYPEQHKVVQRHAKPARTPVMNQNLYSLLGLRHWLSNEGISKR